MLVVAADGSCHGNPGPGGWAWVTADGRSASGGNPATTNNRMELQAVLEAIKAHDEPLLIQTDSQILLSTFTEWLPVWKAKNNLHKQKNTDLILEIDRQLQGREVKFEKVPAHSGHPLNEQADALANAAAGAFAPPGSQPAPERSTRNGRATRPQGFAAKFAGICGNCATRFPVGAEIIKAVPVSGYMLVDAPAASR